MPKTTTDLYRRGNVSGPRMTQVRIGKDMVTYPIAGVDWVVAHSGGVSTFARPGAGKNWWLVPASFEYPPELRVVNDHGEHYNWEPNLDMTLADFVALLAAVEPAFRRIS